jgi:hypothetical protein
MLRAYERGKKHSHPETLEIVITFSRAHYGAPRGVMKSAIRHATRRCARFASAD